MQESDCQTAREISAVPHSIWEGKQVHPTYSQLALKKKNRKEWKNSSSFSATFCQAYYKKL